MYLGPDDAFAGYAFPMQGTDFGPARRPGGGPFGDSLPHLGTGTGDVLPLLNAFGDKEADRTETGVAIPSSPGGSSTADDGCEACGMVEVSNKSRTSAADIGWDETGVGVIATLDGKKK